MKAILVGNSNQLRNHIGQKSKLFWANQALAHAGGQLCAGENGGRIGIAHDLNEC